jgi:hypothetical protein
VIESWRKHDNNVRPHSSRGYHPPAPEVVLWPAKPALAPKPIMHQHSTRTTPWGQATGAGCGEPPSRLSPAECPAAAGGAGPEPQACALIRSSR